MFNWSAFWLVILLVGICAIGAGLLMLVIRFGFWVEDRTGIPGFVVVLVFLFLSIAVFSGSPLENGGVKRLNGLTICGSEDTNET